MLWYQTDLDYIATHRQTVAVMVPVDTEVCVLCENEVYGEFF